MAHGRTVRQAVFGPPHPESGEQHVLTASEDGTARLWSLDGRELGLVAHSSPVLRADFSPDGGTLLTASADGTARLSRTDQVARSLGDWGNDAPGDRPGPVELRGPESPIVAAEFGPGGCLALTAYEDGSTRIWRISGNPEPVPLERSASFVTGAAYQPTGGLLAISSLDGDVRLLDAATHRPVGRPLRHPRPVRAVAFSPDGNRLVTASLDGKARIWDLPPPADEGDPARDLPEEADRELRIQLSIGTFLVALHSVVDAAFLKKDVAFGTVSKR